MEKYKPYGGTLINKTTAMKLEDDRLLEDVVGALIRRVPAEAVGLKVVIYAKGLEILDGTKVKVDGVKYPLKFEPCTFNLVGFVCIEFEVI